MRHYEVDGIVLDGSACDDFNMDMSGETRTKFKAAAGFDPIDIDFAADTLQRRQWNGWRTALIADHVRRIRAGIDGVRSGVELGAYILPPEFLEVAQDAALFSRWLDFLSPHGLLPRLGPRPSLGRPHPRPADPGARRQRRRHPRARRRLERRRRSRRRPRSAACIRDHGAVVVRLRKWTPAALQRVERLSRL